MQRLLAVLLVLIGLIGLALGRLGETTWAPATETTATVTLEDPGPAVVIDPGVLYVGGKQGEVVIEGASDLSVITAANDDITAYLEDTHHTRITGASDWTTLSTKDVNPEGAAEISDPTGSDLWRSVDTAPSPYVLQVEDFHAGENGKNEQAYRALLVVTDGTAPGAQKVSITWPVDAENEWVPYAYAGGAAIAVIGLVLFVVTLGRRREDELDATDAAPAAGRDDAVEPGEPGTAAETGKTDETVELAALRDPAGAREENVWAVGAADTAPEDAADETAPGPSEAADRADGDPADGDPADDDPAEHEAADADRTEQLRAVDEEDPR